MTILDVAIFLFIVLETLNVIIIYFKPDFKYGNGLSVFKGWEKSQKNEGLRLYSNYMANWVGNSKLIFIVLLVVILLTGTDLTKLITVMVMVPLIAVYYLRMHLIIKQLDKIGELKQKGYSKTLFRLITCFIIMFVMCLAIYSI